MSESNSEAVATKSSGRTRSISAKSSGRLKAAKMSEGVPTPVKDRVVGTVWMLTKGVFKTATLEGVKAHLADLPVADVERAVVVLNLEGEIALENARETTLIRLKPALVASFVGTVRERFMKAVSTLRAFATRRKKTA